MNLPNRIHSSILSPFFSYICVHNNYVIKLHALSTHALLYFPKVNSHHMFLCDGVESGLPNRKSIY